MAAPDDDDERIKLPRLLTIRAAARALGVGCDALYSAASRGELEWARLGGRRYVTRAAVEASNLPPPAAARELATPPAGAAVSSRSLCVVPAPDRHRVRGVCLPCRCSRLPEPMRRVILRRGAQSIEP